MKRKDILIIIAVAVVSAIFSYVISNAVFGGTDSSKLLSAPEVQPISADFPQPDPRYFNKESLNPTRDITIGDYSQ